ncbi:MAG TPA: SRPBCC domain-containing protein [Saprospiraceae bacterium]|jgi:uncharacterized protein YndB with AHSA1/START domain
MTNLVLCIDINAPREEVWNAITQDALYRRWTSAFHEGSYFKGGWNKGDSIHFIALNEAGIPEGMASEIAESKHPEYISVRHLGYVKGDEVDTTSDAALEWAPSYENYRLEKIGEHATRFHLEMEIQENYYTMFENLWPKAMALLKDVCEEKNQDHKRITVIAMVGGEEGKVWSYWTGPDHIMKWNAASDDWHCPYAENDVRVGGRFKSTMAAKDGSMSFDFGGVYTLVDYGHRLSYTMDDGRKADIVFSFQSDKICVMVTFDAETQNSVELQRGGWQAILDRFKAYVEEN